MQKYTHFKWILNDKCYKTKGQQLSSINLGIWVPLIKLMQF